MLVLIVLLEIFLTEAAGGDIYSNGGEALLKTTDPPKNGYKSALKDVFWPFVSKKSTSGKYDKTYIPPDKAVPLDVVPAEKHSLPANRVCKDRRGICKGPCREGFNSFNNVCYKYIYHKMDFASAELKKTWKDSMCEKHYLTNEWKMPIKAENKGQIFFESVSTMYNWNDKGIKLLFCQQEYSGHLASIHCRLNYLFVTDIIRESYFDCPQTWIGLTDATKVLVSGNNTVISWNIKKQNVIFYNVTSKTTLKTEAYIQTIIVCSDAICNICLHWKEGYFLWTDGTKLDHTAWSKGEPSDLIGHQNCVVLDRKGYFLWTDEECSKELNFVCAYALPCK